MAPNCAAKIVHLSCSKELLQIAHPAPTFPSRFSSDKAIFEEQIAERHRSQSHFWSVGAGRKTFGPLFDQKGAHSPLPKVWVSFHENQNYV